MTRKAACHFYMDPVDYDRIKELSRKTLVPMSAYFRMGMEWVLEVEEERWDELMKIEREKDGREQA